MAKKDNYQINWAQLGAVKDREILQRRRGCFIIAFFRKMLKETVEKAYITYSQGQGRG